jgi:hypothetical protein
MWRPPLDLIKINHASFHFGVRGHFNAVGCVSFVMQASVLDGFAFDPSLSSRSESLPR